MTVYIPGPLRSYTARKSEVEASGATVGEVLADLDRRFPGMRFRMIDEQDRIREHIKIFVNEEAVRELKTAVTGEDAVNIICAISGG